MEKNNENAVSDSMDDDYVTSYENISSDEIKLKINTFRNLCMGNKINAANAFDIDMIGYFATWVKKRKPTENDVESFQDIADYLDATEKVYCARVDNICESTSKLVEQFRGINYKKTMLNSENEKELSKIPKPKRPKMMLTTSEKLNCKLTEANNFVDPSIKQGIINFNFNDLFEYHRPADYMQSLYYNYSLEEEKQKLKDLKSEEPDTTAEDEDLGNFHLTSIDFGNAVICPDFHRFVDPNDKVLEKEEAVMEGIEHRFDPDNNLFQNSDDSDSENQVDFDPSLNDETKAEIDGLLECVDNVNRDYSFFNPKLLANWKGPKAWKAQAMMKALKSCKPNEQKNIISNSDVHEEIEEIAQVKTKTRKYKKRTKDEIKVQWLTIDEFDKCVQVKSKEKLLPRSLQKWDPYGNIEETKSIFNIKHRFEFLEYLEIFPDWWMSQKNINALEGDNSSELSPDYQGNCDYAADVDDIDDVVPNETIRVTNKKLFGELMEINESESHDDILKEFKTESRMDIGDLKREISKIIDQECVKINPVNQWSTGLNYSKLLNKLRINNREGYTEAMVFVGFLHLVNERGLKLHQQPTDSLNDINDIIVFKPMN